MNLLTVLPFYFLFLFFGIILEDNELACSTSFLLFYFVFLEWSWRTMNLLTILPFYFFIFYFWNDLRGRGTCLLICTLLTLPHYFLRRWSGCKSRRTLIVADSSSSNSQGTCWTLRCASWHVAALVTSDNSSNLQSICVYDNFLHLITYILAEAAVCMYLCNGCAWHGAGLIELTYIALLMYF